MRTFSEIADRLIAVDTEFKCLNDLTAPSRLARETGIETVYCASFTHGDDSFSVWTGDGGQGVLEAAARRFGISDPVFVSFFYNAEWEAFKRLGVDISEYQWIDVFLLYRLYRNFFGSHPELSLAAMCKDVLGEEIDTARKELMQSKCISGAVSGFEAEIMAYCEDDTLCLIPALFELEKRLTDRRDSPKTLAINASHRQWKGESIPDAIFDLMRSLAAFTRISHRGLPVSGERLDAVRAGARVMRDRMIADFVKRYPGSFDRVEPIKHFRTLPFVEAAPGSPGKWRRNDRTCRQLLLDDLTARGALDDYPLTDSGKLSLASDALDDYFKKESGTFGGDFRTLTKKLTCFAGILAEGKKDWLAAFDRVDGLMRFRTLAPFQTVTGRCAPSPSAGWIFGWDKSLYCVFDPAPGRWLVELDFSSEETCIQAQVFNDPAYKELYRSKDIYLYTGVLTGIIPRDEFEELPKSELKAKFKRKRDLLKTFTLAIGYGAGNSTLCAKTKLPLETVAAFRERYNAAFERSTLIRTALKVRLESGETTALWLANSWHAGVNWRLLRSFNSPLNFPIQGTGAVILHKLVQRLESEGVRTLATIHDAVFFEVDEGDFTAIDRVKTLMIETANGVLGVAPGEPGIKVGEPEIIRHGDVWTPEHEYDDQAREILRAGGLDV